MYPPTSPNLIEEFRGRASNVDTNFNVIVKSAEAMEQKAPDRTFANLMEAIGTNDITRYFPFVNTKVEAMPTRAILNRIQQESAGKIKLGLDLQGGTEFLVSMDTNRLSSSADRSHALEQAVEVLRRRVDKFGVAEPVIEPVGDNQIQIQLPGLSESDKENAKKQLQKAAFLEFRLVHPDSKQLVGQGIGMPGYEILKEQRVDSATGQKDLIPYMVKKKAERGLTGKNVKSAMVSRDPMTGNPEINFTLDADGAKAFADVTRENVGKQLAIVLDGELVSAPVINGEIPQGRGVIQGHFSIKEAFMLATSLENPLEAPVVLQQERGVDPTLGRDSIASGIRACVIGTLAVSGFMASYYLLAGIVANIALILNIIILFGVMCSVGTTLTLPGIAGIVLTIGMAVDANVLIFERIREESGKGKSLRGAIEAGYNRAFGTIFDSHVTTLISSVILIYMGTGSIKGFGVSLTIGVAASLFTALVVTRLIFDVLLNKELLKSLPMMHIIRATKLRFMSLAKPAFIISWTLIVIGLSYGIFVRGHNLLGVEFAGGDNIILSFSKKVEVDKLRASLSAAGINDPKIQYGKDIVGGTETLEITARFGAGDQAVSALVKDFPDAKFSPRGIKKVGPTIGAEIRKTAISASLLSLFGILIYVAFRYEFSFSVGAVLAVIHDVLMTIGCYCLSGREFDAAMVAAVLTIIGFSINDTIVIFDRIREDLKLGIRGSFRELIDQALNQTLSRTLITSGTVFLATLSLYIFGGGAVNNFAFTFLVGIITGTYSSIYIASALVLWWHKGERPKTGSQVIVERETAARV